MSIQSCRSLLKVDKWSGSALLQVFNLDVRVDIVPPLTA